MPRCRFLPLQELQHPVQIGIRRREVLPVDPRPVSRHVRARLRHVRQERVGQEDDLLFGLARVHRVDGEQFRGQLARRRLALLADRDPRILSGRPVVVELGGDLDHLPPVRAVKAVVGGEKSLQQRGSAAHHADHHDRRDDDFFGDLGMPADPLLGTQSHPQAVHETRAQDVHADVVQVCRGVAVGQHAQRFVERQRAPIGKALLLLRAAATSPVASKGFATAVRTSGGGWCRRPGRRT